MIKAVIFDLDGVLVSTDALHYTAWKQLADSRGIYFSRKINNRLRGVSRMESLEIILERTGRQYSRAEKEAMCSEKNAGYVKLLDSIGPEAVLADVTETLEKLKAEGYLMAVGSSSKNAGKILARTALRDSFDALADGNDISRSKPDPEVFLKAAERLGVEPEYCAVVEDADAGIQAAKAAGMTAFAVGQAVKCPLADCALERLGQLCDKLKEY